MKEYYPFKKKLNKAIGGTLNRRFFQETLYFEDFQTLGTDEYFVLRFFKSPELGFIDFGIIEKKSTTIVYCKFKEPWAILVETT